MGYKVGPHILYSKNVHELAHFISEILDMELFTKREGEILLSNDLLSLLILESFVENVISEQNRQSIILSFTLDSYESLENLLYKVEFLSYRHAEAKTSHESKVTCLTSEDKSHFFLLTDFDGRVWKFSYNSIV